VAGRPRSFDREAALAVAIEQFWRHGYDETSLAMLTSAMGVKPPSLYAAFGDKQRLFEEASTVYFERTCAAIDRAAELPTAHEFVARMLEDTACAHTDSDTPPGCLMLTDPKLDAQREVVHQRLRDRLDRGVRDGDLAPSVDTGQLASFLVAVMRGMSGCARDGGSAEEVRGIAAVALDAWPSDCGGSEPALGELREE
jgi:AcrR family transcriptional regulator